MGYDRAEYMRRQDAEHAMIAMREPVRQSSPHPDPRDEIIQDLVNAVLGLLVSHKPGRGECCEAADRAIDVITKARGAA